MAGKHRNKRVSGYSEHINLRIPGALKADLQDAALEHGISMNEEIVRILTHGPVHLNGYRHPELGSVDDIELLPGSLSF